jgi:hypothetical protein
MSKLSEYSKFDHIDEGDSSEDEKIAPAVAADSHQPGPINEAIIPVSIRQHTSLKNRFIFEHQGSPLYEFEQSLSEVILYIPAPPVQSSSLLHCQISPHHLQLGLRGSTQMFLDEDTYETVDVSESTWCLEDDKIGNTNRKLIVIYLHKVAKGVVWKSALKNRWNVTIDEFNLQQVQQQLLLERWQEENPGMDFRDATFNGSAPDPRTFMGGVKYL